MVEFQKWNEETWTETGMEAKNNSFQKEVLLHVTNGR